MAGATEDWSTSDGDVYNNVRYGYRGCQKFDMYVPKGLDKSKPVGVILFVHGGTWYAGSKDNFTWGCRRYAKLGYITATMDYDLADQGGEGYAKATGSKPGSTVFDMVEDIGLCVKALDMNIRALGYNPYGLALCGESAGSHLTMMFGYGHDKESAIPVKMIMNVTSPVSWTYGTFNNYTAAEQAKYINMIAGYNLTAEDIEHPSPEVQKQINAISPITFIHEGSCPTLMGFAGKDTTIGTNQYNTIKPVLDKYNVPNDVVWWPNSDHTLIADREVLGGEWLQKSSQWLARYLTPVNVK